MSVRFISGKPGGGKTLYSVSLILEELRRSDRVIATNVSLNMGRLCEYLQQHYGRDFSARWRVLKLEPEHVGEFFRHWSTDAPPLEKKAPIKLPGGKTVERLSYQERIQLDKMGVPEFEVEYWWQELVRLRRPGRGVVYVLDEVHEFFNARRWADTGDEVLHYLSQHRKLGDDVICITQSIGNVDKQFRSVAQDFTYLRNHGKESIPILGGLVRGVRMFSRDTYLEPFTGTQRSIETRTFRLDTKGIASCYDTAAGVGIQGAGADTSERRKGLHPAWLFVAVAALAWFLYTVPDAMAGRVAGKAAALEAERAASNSPPAAAVGKVQVVPLVTNQAPSTGTLVAMREEKTPPLYLRGVVHGFGKSPMVFLSDGRVLTPRDPELEGFGRTWAKVSGKIVRMQSGG